MVILIALSGSLFQGQGPDWQDFVGIICLLIINSTISFIEENNAGNAAAALMAHLAPKTKVCPFFWCLQFTLQFKMPALTSFFFIKESIIPSSGRHD